MIDLSVNSNVIHDVGLVIFDKDGTLIELYHYWSQMVALRARLICEVLGLGHEHETGLRWALGVDERAGRLRPEGPVGLKKREIVIQAATDYLDGIGHRDTLRLCKQAFGRADEISSVDLGRFIRPIRGAVSLMSALRDRGCRVALATVDLSQRARLAIEQHACGINGDGDIVVHMTRIVIAGQPGRHTQIGINASDQPWAGIEKLLPRNRSQGFYKCSRTDVAVRCNLFRKIPTDLDKFDAFNARTADPNHLGSLGRITRFGCPPEIQFREIRGTYRDNPDGTSPGISRPVQGPRHEPCFFGPAQALQHSVNGCQGIRVS